MCVCLVHAHVFVCMCRYVHVDVCVEMYVGHVCLLCCGYGCAVCVCSFAVVSMLFFVGVVAHRLSTGCGGNYPFIPPPVGNLEEDLTWCGQRHPDCPAQGFLVFSQHTHTCTHTHTFCMYTCTHLLLHGHTCTRAHTHFFSVLTKPLGFWK